MDRSNVRVTDYFDDKGVIVKKYCSERGNRDSGSARRHQIFDRRFEVQRSRRFVRDRGRTDRFREEGRAASHDDGRQRAARRHPFAAPRHELEEVRRLHCDVIGSAVGQRTGEQEEKNKRPPSKKASCPANGKGSLNLFIAADVYGRCNRFASSPRRRSSSCNRAAASPECIP